MLRAIAILLTCLLVISAGLHINTAAAAQPLEASDREWQFEVDAIQISTAALADKQGRYAMSRVRTSISYAPFTLGYTYRDFDWQGVELLPFGNGQQDPWRGFHTLEFKTTFKGPLAGNWRYNCSAELSSSFETEIGSPSLDILAAGGYNFSPRLKVRAGVALLLHEVRTVIVPLAALKWWGGGKSADEPLFSVAVGLPETTVTYHHSPRWEFTASLLVDSKVSGLADDSQVVAQGFAETRDVVFGVLTRYRPTSTVTLSTGVGYDAFRRLTLHDRRGDELAEYDVEGGWAGRFSLDYRF